MIKLETKLIMLWQVQKSAVRMADQIKKLQRLLSKGLLGVYVILSNHQCKLPTFYPEEDIKG